MKRKQSDWFDGLHAAATVLALLTASVAAFGIAATWSLLRRREP